MTSSVERARELRLRATQYRDLAVHTSDQKMQAILLRLAAACEEAAARLERDSGSITPDSED